MPRQDFSAHHGSRSCLLNVFGVAILAMLSAGCCFADEADDGLPARQTSLATRQPPDKAVPELPGVSVEEIDPSQPVRPGFVINVSVEKEPEPSGSYTIDAAGDILIHIADMTTSVAVSGQSPARCAETITHFLKTYIRNPHVGVSIVSVPLPVVSIGGAVRTSGQMTVSSMTTLADVLSRAEWTEKANLNQVRILRRPRTPGKESVQVLTLHLDAYMMPGPGRVPDEAQNPILQDRDSIFVPFKSLASNGTITVSGAVNKPQTEMPLRASPPLSLREAISLSGGITADADHRKVSVRRAGSDQPLLLDLDRAEQNDTASNLILLPGDSIYVGKRDSNAYFTINGGVIKAGKFPFEKPITLSQGLMAAGGVAPNAHDKQGVILRCPDGIPDHTHIVAFNWQQILAGKMGDLPLMPGDNVWIAPGTSGRPMDLFSILSALGSLRLLF